MNDLLVFGAEVRTLDPERPFASAPYVKTCSIDLM